jgi:hypothetical protein
LKLAYGELLNPPFLSVKRVETKKLFHEIRNIDLVFGKKLFKSNSPFPITLAIGQVKGNRERIIRWDGIRVAV